MLPAAAFPGNVAGKLPVRVSFVFRLQAFAAPHQTLALRCCCFAFLRRRLSFAQ